MLSAVTSRPERQKLHILKILVADSETSAVLSAAFHLHTRFEEVRKCWQVWISWLCASESNRIEEKSISRSHVVDADNWQIKQFERIRDSIFYWCVRKNYKSQRTGVERIETEFWEMWNVIEDGGTLKAIKY